MQKIGVLFVCLGNICRSPTAEGVFRARAEQVGLADRLHIDSAGTAGWHIGKSPDPRTVRYAQERGYDLSMLRARQVMPADLDAFDYVLAMDHDNHHALLRMATPMQRERVALFLDYAPACGLREVPDPYYGGAEDFRRVLDLVEQASAGLLIRIKERLA